MPRMQKPGTIPPNCTHTSAKAATTSEDVKLRILAANLRKQFAKDILFTDEYFVGNAIGDFAVGDSVKDLSIAEILIKLLSLTNIAQEPEAPPDLPPTEDDSLANLIIKNKAPIYQIDNNFRLTAVPFNFKQFTETSYSAEPVEKQTTFYQKVDANDKVVEFGYQHCTNMQEMYYVVALPEELKIGENVKLLTWSAVESCWKEIPSPLTCDFNEISQAFEEVGLAAPTALTGYTLWVDLRDIDPGTIYRYIIIE